MVNILLSQSFFTSSAQKEKAGLKPASTMYKRESQCVVWVREAEGPWILGRVHRNDHPQLAKTQAPAHLLIFWP